MDPDGLKKLSGP
uniref:Uncharacterized protein n=1 Tax=Arundo donax TaxID=35708 RepID=A0A0A9A7J5_ARUDO